MKSMVLPSQAYEVKLAHHPAPVSVFRSMGHDEVCQLRRYEGKLTGPIGALLGTK
jgi:type VI secretion system secreted protein VgrG